MADDAADTDETDAEKGSGLSKVPDPTGGSPEAQKLGAAVERLGTGRLSATSDGLTVSDTAGVSRKRRPSLFGRAGIRFWAAEAKGKLPWFLHINREASPLLQYASRYIVLSCTCVSVVFLIVNSLGLVIKGHPELADNFGGGRVDAVLLVQVGVHLSYWSLLANSLFFSRVQSQCHWRNLYFVSLLAAGYYTAWSLENKVWSILLFLVAYGLMTVVEAVEVWRRKHKTWEERPTTPGGRIRSAVWLAIDAMIVVGLVYAMADLGFSSSYGESLRHQLTLQGDYIPLADRHALVIVSWKDAVIGLALLGYLFSWISDWSTADVTRNAYYRLFLGSLRLGDIGRLANVVRDKVSEAQVEKTRLAADRAGTLRQAAGAATHGTAGPAPVELPADRPPLVPADAEGVPAAFEVDAASTDFVARCLGEHLSELWRDPQLRAARTCIDELRLNVPASPGKKSYVLDIGCGAGQRMIDIAYALGLTSLPLIGIDNDEAWEPLHKQTREQFVQALGHIDCADRAGETSQFLHASLQDGDIKVHDRDEPPPPLDQVRVVFLSHVLAEKPFPKEAAAFLRKHPNVDVLVVIGCNDNHYVSHFMQERSMNGLLTKEYYRWKGMHLRTVLGRPPLADEADLAPRTLFQASRRLELDARSVRYFSYWAETVYGNAIGSRMARILNDDRRKRRLSDLVFDDAVYVFLRDPPAEPGQARGEWQALAFDEKDRVCKKWPLRIG